MLDGDRAKIKADVARQIEAGASPSGWFIMGVGSLICDGTYPEAIDVWTSETREASRK